MSEGGVVPGAHIGPYEVVSLLGRGGMGEVYRAKDLRLSREVALKVLHGEVDSDPERVRRFEQEARAAGLLNHPNIVAVYDIGHQEGSPYIVSELLQGETLRDRMATGTLGWRKVVECGVQIAHGLTAAHEKGIVHRDLKPENLFLTKDGLVKILDFGIAKLGRPGEAAGTDIETLSQTNPGTILGTAGYMSPEQVRGLVADHRSDLFSFGAVLFEMLTGRRAFKGTTAADTLSAVLREDPTDGLTTGNGISPSLLAVVRRCLEKAPEDRFQTARDLAFALGTTLSESGSHSSARGRLRTGFRRPWLALAGLLGLLSALGIGWWVGHTTAAFPPPTTFERLSFRLGQVDTARFAPDGETILYSARWDKSPHEIFLARASTRGSRPLGLTNALILSISPREEMAVLLRPQNSTWSTFEGTLATAPMAGGVPREILEGVRAADWSPDGNQLAVIHIVGDRHRLEYPIGKVLYEPAAPIWMSDLRVSPQGDQIAFFEHPVANDVRGTLSVIDRGGQRKGLSAAFPALKGLRWSLDGKKLWYSASRSGGTPQDIHELTLSGQDRVIVETPGGFMLLDVGKDGRALGVRVSGWTETRARARGAREEADLPAADLSFLADLSDDGTTILGTDEGAGGSNPRLYIQGTDGSPAVWLGEGDAQALSPDGHFVLAVLRHTSPEQLIVVPTRAGETRTLEPGPVMHYQRAVWDPAGRRLVFAGIDGNDQERIYVQDLASGPPRPVTEDVAALPMLGRPVSPDGERVIAVGPDGLPALYPLRGGEPKSLPGLGELDLPLSWTADGREVVVAHYDQTPPRIEWLEVASGRTRPWKALGRSSPSGQTAQYRILVTPDGESYAYSYFRQLGDLYLTSKLN